MWKCHICRGSVLPSLSAFTLPLRGYAFKWKAVCCWRARVFVCACVRAKQHFCLDHSCRVHFEQHILTVCAVCMMWMSGLLDLSRYLREIRKKTHFKNNHKYFSSAVKSSKPSLKTASAISQEKSKGKPKPNTLQTKERRKANSCFAPQRRESKQLKRRKVSKWIVK